MADPRLFTVKQCEPAYSMSSGAAIGNASNTRRDFFNAVGKIGDLQVLNSVGGGSVASGLRNLASISNSIRVGTGSLPTSIGSSLDSGANWVLNQTGIAGTVVDAVRGFNPGIANQAYGQAKSVFEQVKGGNFKSSSIPYVLQDFQNLERLGRNIFTPGTFDVQSSLTERCDASPYAMDLIARAPKYKFLFVVQFVPNAPYSELGTHGLGPLDMAFVVKHSTRPNVVFQQEDVNYYNYRTKVVTRTQFQDMNMTFHDDTNNTATLFHKAYLRAMSPITGLTPDQALPSMLEASGMNFVGRTLINGGDVYAGIQGSAYASSTGPLAANSKTIFKEIRIFHIFDYGNQMNVYRFANPSITMLALDDLDMSVGNEGNEMSITFNYDSIYVDAGVPLASPGSYNITDAQRGSYYPLRYNGESILGTSATTTSPVTILGTEGGFGNNPLQAAANGIAGTAASLGNAAVASVSNLGSKFSNVFGSVPFV